MYRLCAEDEQRKSEEEELAYLSGYINSEHELEQDQLEEKNGNIRQRY